MLLGDPPSVLPSNWLPLPAVGRWFEPLMLPPSRPLTKGPEAPCISYADMHALWWACVLVLGRESCVVNGPVNVRMVNAVKNLY